MKTQLTPLDHRKFTRKFSWLLTDIIRSAFVAAYVAEVLKHEAGSSWSIAESVRHGNIASALTSMEMGYDRALPWAWQIENFETSSVALPLFANLAEVRNPPPRQRRGGGRRALGYPGLEQ